MPRAFNFRRPKLGEVFLFAIPVVLIVGMNLLPRLKPQRQIKPKPTVAPASNTFLALAYAPDDDRLATIDRLGEVQWWNGRDGSLIKSLGARVVDACDSEFSRDGNYYAAYNYRDLHLFDGHTGKELWSVKTSPSNSSYVRFSPDGRYIACGGEAKIWECSTGKLFASGPKGVKLVEDLDFSPDGRLAVMRVGRSQGDGKRVTIANSLLLWDITKRKIVWEKLDNIGYFGRVLYLPNGKIAAAGGGELQILEASDGKPVVRKFQISKAEPPNPFGDVHDPKEMILCEDGTAVLGCNRLEDLMAWDLTRWKTSSWEEMILYKDIDGVGRMIREMALSVDETKFAYIQGSGKLIMLDMQGVKASQLAADPKQLNKVKVLWELDPTSGLALKPTPAPTFKDMSN